MADRPFFAGWTGSAFRIRQAAIGYDALTAPLDNLVFDSAAYPGRISGRGEVLADGSTIPNTPVETRIPHGLARLPSHIIAVARPENRDTQAPEDWWSRMSYQGFNSYGTFGGTELGKKYCSPFVVGESAIAENFATIMTAGWHYRFDANDLIVTSYLAFSITSPITYYKLRVRWVALEL